MKLHKIYHFPMEAKKNHITERNFITSTPLLTSFIKIISSIEVSSSATEWTLQVANKAVPNMSGIRLSLIYRGILSQCFFINDALINTINITVRFMIGGQSSEMHIFRARFMIESGADNGIGIIRIG